MNPDTGNVYELDKDQDLPEGHIELPHPPAPGCIRCRGKGSVQGVIRDQFVPCPVCYPDWQGRLDALQEEVDKVGPNALRALLLPSQPNPKCRHGGCYGRGHIGFNSTTQKFRPCPKCFPGAAESTLTPHEIYAATEAALEDPEQAARLIDALEQVPVDGGEAADKILAEAAQADAEKDGTDFAEFEEVTDARPDPMDRTMPDLTGQDGRGHDVVVHDEADDYDYAADDRNFDATRESAMGRSAGRD